MLQYMGGKIEGTVTTSAAVVFECASGSHTLVKIAVDSSVDPGLFCLALQIPQVENQFGLQPAVSIRLSVGVRVARRPIISHTLSPCSCLQSPTTLKQYPLPYPTPPHPQFSIAIFNPTTWLSRFVFPSLVTIVGVYLRN